MAAYERSRNDVLSGNVDVMKKTYIELHNSKAMYSEIKGSLKLIKNLKMNPLIKESIITSLNKIKQWLSLPNLKMREE